MATEKNLKKLTIHKLKKKTYNALAEKPVDELVMLTDVGGQVAEITEASADYVGEIVQYVGETNDTYTNGYFYKCVETDGAYSWIQANVQEGGGGGNVSPVFNEPIEVTVESGYLSLVDILTFTTRERKTGNHENELKACSFIGQKGLYLNFFLHPLEDNKSYIGNKNYRWKSVATTMLNNGEPLNVPTVGGTLARIEDINNIVEVLPTADNGHTTVKNFGNNYIEATGIYEVGSVEANAEVVDVIPFPEGIQFEEGQMYWANAHATTEDPNSNIVVAHIVSRGATDLTIVYKNLGSTDVENLTICWEARGVVAAK